MMQRPNFILITIDALRRDILNCYEADRSITPNLDRLAREGVLFIQAITAGSWTQSAFPPLLTSSYASSYGGCLNGLSPERPSPIEALCSSGYHTAGFSNNPHLSAQTGYSRGFEHFKDLEPGQNDPWLRKVKGGQRLLRWSATHRISRLFGITLRPGRVYSSAEETTQCVCAWLAQCRVPFFTWVHYMDVHWPYHIEERLSSPKELAQAWQDLSIMYRWTKDPACLISQHQVDRFRLLYEQSLQYLDEQVGRLVRAVDQDRRLHNTIFIVTSDHGEEFLDHGRWGHWESNLYDEILRVPLFIRLPDRQPRFIHRQVRSLDIMPTILDLSGCNPPENLEGKSLSMLWSENDTSPARILEDANISISEMYRPPWHRIAVRTEEYKLIWDNKQPDKPLLFDLRLDPGETRNVSSDHREQLNSLHAIVNTHLQRKDAKIGPSTYAPVVELDEKAIQRLHDLGYWD